MAIFVFELLFRNLENRVIVIVTPNEPVLLLDISAFPG